MSVLVEAFTVVVPRGVIEESFEAGLDGYASLVPNGTLRSDAHLTAVSFMTLADVDWYLEELNRQGVVVVTDGRSDEVAIVDQLSGAMESREWLSFEAGNNAPAECWWTEAEKGAMQTYEGWTLEHSLSNPSPPVETVVSEPAVLRDATRLRGPLPSTFDRLSLAEAIQAELEETTSMYERSQGTDEHCDLWYFEVDDLAGFISCEDNESDIRVPTVTLAIGIGIADELTRDELMGLMERNNHLYQCSIVITPPLPMGEEHHRMIAVHRRVDARTFHPQAFLDHLNDLQVNSELFLGNEVGGETLH